MIVSYGVIPIFIEKAGSRKYLVLKSHDGFWGFPKGHPEDSETPRQSAVREAYEETGIAVEEATLQLGEFKYEYEQPMKGEIQTKRVVLYPVIVNSEKVTTQAQEIAEYKWADSTEAMNLINLSGASEMLRNIENKLNT